MDAIGCRVSLLKDHVQKHFLPHDRSSQPVWLSEALLTLKQDISDSSCFKLSETHMFHDQRPFLSLDLGVPPKSVSAQWVREATLVGDIKQSRC